MHSIPWYSHKYNTNSVEHSPRFIWYERNSEHKVLCDLLGSGLILDRTNDRLSGCNCSAIRSMDRAHWLSPMSKYRAHVPVRHTGVTHQFTWHGSRINSKRGFLTSCSGYRQYTGVMNIWLYKIVKISCQSDITYTVSTINCACMCNHVRDDITFYQASRYPHNHNVNLILHQTVLKPYRVSYAILFCMTKHTHKLKDIFSACEQTRNVNVVSVVPYTFYDRHLLLFLFPHNI